MTPEAALERGLGELGMQLPQGAAEKLLRYVRLMSKWNHTYNLTAIRDPLEMIGHHLLDSLAVVPHLPVREGAAVADIGTGAGLPGIPLAIARPSWQVTLNESTEKKAAFLRQAAIELSLPNVAVHQGRAETWRPTARFALVISRALAELVDLVALARPLLAEGGYLAAMKGVYPRAEIDAVSTACPDLRVIELKVPLLDAQRHLVLCQAGG